MDTYRTDKPKLSIIVIHAVIVFLGLMCVGSIVCSYMPSIAYMFVFQIYTYICIIFGFILYTLLNYEEQTCYPNEVTE